MGKIVWLLKKDFYTSGSWYLYIYSILSITINLIINYQFKSLQFKTIEHPDVLTVLLTWLNVYKLFLCLISSNYCSRATRTFSPSNHWTHLNSRSNTISLFGHPCYKVLPCFQPYQYSETSITRPSVTNVDFK